MNQLEITFLGTGTSQGVPLIGCDCDVCTSSDLRDKRLRSSVLVSTEGKNIVIDTGPDFRYQMLREKVTHLDAILYTHQHIDHLAGLDDIRPFNYHSKRAIDVYATAETELAIRRTFAYIFDNPTYPGIPQIKINLINDVEFDIHGIKVQPIQLMHYQLPVLGFRIGNFSYVTDANYISDQEKSKLKGSDIIVLNALRRETHISHFSLNEAVELLEELSPKAAYLIHMSHQVGKHEETEAELPSFIKLAYDGLKVKIGV